MKNKSKDYQKLSIEECLKLLQEQDKRIEELESKKKKQEEELSELSARKAYLDEIKQQNSHS